MRDEREMGKKNHKNFTIPICMLPNLRLYCSLKPNILAFKTPDVSDFLVFGVWSFLFYFGHFRYFEVFL